MATSEQHEEVAAIKAVQDGDADLKLVGYYCAGGHPIDGHEGIASASLRFDDPCEFGVPVFVLTKDNPRVQAAITMSSDCREEQWPWDMVKQWVGRTVRVHADRGLLGNMTITGTLVLMDHLGMRVMEHGANEPTYLSRGQVKRVEDLSRQ